MHAEPPVVTSPTIILTPQGREETREQVLVEQPVEVALNERVIGSAMVLAEKRKVRLLSLAGQQPAAVGVDAGYPMRKTFRLLIRNDTRQGIRAFTAFIASPEGKKILAELGVVPVEE